MWWLSAPLIVRLIKIIWFDFIMFQVFEDVLHKTIIVKSWHRWHIEGNMGTNSLMIVICVLCPGIYRFGWAFGCLTKRRLAINYLAGRKYSCCFVNLCLYLAPWSTRYWNRLEVENNMSVTTIVVGYSCSSLTELSSFATNLKDNNVSENYKSSDYT